MIPHATAAPLRAFDVESVRRDFPILSTRVHGFPLVYLDNAATTQKPRAVLDALTRFYERACSNVHRGIHTLSERATADFEAARATAARFVHARDPSEVIFVRGTTEAINLVAHCYGTSAVRAGDEIVLTIMEHHSNIVPWQVLADRVGARLRVVPMNDSGELDLEELDAQLGPRSRLVAITHVSNALGTVNPVRQIVELAHARNVPVLIDGAQAAAHLPIDVQALDCDFYAFSGHKLYGPTGIGVLYGKRERLEPLPPYQAGGDMIRSVTFEKTTYNRLPYRFEAGTPDIAGAIGLGAAIDYLSRVGLDAAAAYERELFAYAQAALAALPGLRLLGTAREKVSVQSFVLDGIHAHDVGTVLDQHGIAVRAGHHCAQPLMHRLGVPATVRASVAFYNTRAEIDALVAGLEQVRQVFE